MWFSWDNSCSSICFNFRSNHNRSFVQYCKFYFCRKIKPKLKYDDPLDAFGCHGISGILGSILTGVFANKAINSNISESGLLYGGVHLFLIQVLGTVCTIIFVIILSTILVVCCKKLVKMRVTSEEELIGLDK